MGSIIPHYLFVVCYSLDEVLQVHEMAKEIFNPKDQSEKLVSQLNLTSFFVLCNGRQAYKMGKSRRVYESK
ncbi:hypothetical protein ACS2QU_31245, partial [Bacillus cereus group sp. Bce005]